MKPSGPVANGLLYHVRAVDFSTGANFIRQNHYAKGCSNTAVFMHGLFLGEELVGVAQWLPPTKVCAQSVSRDNWTRVLSLSRLAVRADQPQNCASMLIGRSIRLIRSEGKWTALVTYADESQGHTGAIYRATNWTYVGRTKPQPRWVAPDGRQVSKKSTVTRTTEKMLELGFARDGSHRKHKFIMVLDK